MWELMGYKSSNTTEIYTHISKREIKKIKSLLMIYKQSLAKFVFVLTFCYGLFHSHSALIGSKWQSYKRVMANRLTRRRAVRLRLTRQWFRKRGFWHARRFDQVGVWRSSWKLTPTPRLIFQGVMTAVWIYNCSRHYDGFGVTLGVTLPGFRRLGVYFLSKRCNSKSDAWDQRSFVPSPRK